MFSAKDLSRKDLERSLIMALMFFALIVFVRIGLMELQPGEAANALRAEYYLAGANDVPDSIIDSEPPLNSIFIGFFTSTFGNKGYAVRLFSGISALISLALFFVLIRRYLSTELSLGAAVVLVATLSWNSSSRLALPIAPMTVFVLLSLYFLVKINREKTLQANLAFMAGYGISFVCALLSDGSWSLAPLFFAIAFMFTGNTVFNKVALVIVVMFSLRAAGFWYIPAYNEIGIQAFFAGSFSDGAQNLFGLIRSLLIDNPFFIFSLIGFVILIFRLKTGLKKEENSDYYILAMCSGIWFLFALVSYLIFGGELSYITPPAALMAVYFLKEFQKSHTNYNKDWAVLIILISSFAYSFLRIINESYINGNENPAGSSALLIFIGFASFSLSMTFWGDSPLLRKISAKTLPFLMMFALFIMFARIMLLNSFFEGTQSLGSIAAAYTVNDTKSDSIVYVYHDYGDGNKFNAQLHWYLRKLKKLEADSIKYIPIGVPSDKYDIHALKRIDDYAEMTLVYYIKEINPYAPSIIRYISSTRPFLNYSGNYLVFGSKRRDIEKGKTF